MHVNLWLDGYTERAYINVDINSHVYDSMCYLSCKRVNACAVNICMCALEKAMQ